MTIEDSSSTAYHPANFLLPSPPTFHPAACVPFIHWQLRSLLTSPNTDTLYYPSATHIYRYHVPTQQLTHECTLPFSSRCIASGHGYLAVGGGDHGKFSTLHIATQTLRTLVLGGSIVNSVTLHRTTDGDVRAVATNNDKTVRIISIPTHRVLAEYAVGFHTNHASVTPDGELVVVGDGPSVVVYGREQRMLELPECEPMMGTAVSPDGAHVAVAAQTGWVVVVEVRTLRVVARIPTRAAVRSVLFSPPPWDLLIWAEHEGRFGIADRRGGYRRRQVVAVGGEERAEAESYAEVLRGGGVDITGLAVSADGRRVFVATETGVVAFDVDTRGRRCFGKVQVR